MTIEIKKELRFSKFALEKRAKAEDPTDTKNVLVGYASVFDHEANIAGQFIEVVRKGAFTRAIKEEQDVRALVDHESSKVIGRTKAGTLKLSEDNIGLRVEIDVPDTQIGKDLLISVERGDVDQMSIGFIIRSQKWESPEQGSGDLMKRNILDVDLFDISAVTFPAFEKTSIGIKRSAENILEEGKEELRIALAEICSEVDIEKMKLNLLELE